MWEEFICYWQEPGPSPPHRAVRSTPASSTRFQMPRSPQEETLIPLPSSAQHALLPWQHSQWKGLSFPLQSHSPYECQTTHTTWQTVLVALSPILGQKPTGGSNRCCGRRLFWLIAFHTLTTRTIFCLSFPTKNRNQNLLNPIQSHLAFSNTKAQLLKELILKNAWAFHLKHAVKWPQPQHIHNLLRSLKYQVLASKNQERRANCAAQNSTAVLRKISSTREALCKGEQWSASPKILFPM